MKTQTQTWTTVFSRGEDLSAKANHIPFRDGSDIITLEIRTHDGGSEVTFHGLASPEQIMDLGRRIETAGAELANRMRLNNVVEEKSDPFLPDWTPEEILTRES